MSTALVQIRGRQVVVASINTRHYGHMALEMLMALAEARQRAAAVVWTLGGERSISPGLAGLTATDVPVLDSPVERTVALLVRTAGDLRDRARVWWRGAMSEARRQAMTEYRRPQYPPELRRWLKEFADARQREAAPERSEVPYFRRALLRSPVPVRQREPFASAAQARAAALGIGPDAPLVVLHVREAGFKLGREMQDAKENARDDSSRNARIEAFAGVLDLLQARGYRVVRIGDNSMTPFAHPALVDLTRLTPYDSHLEVHCLLRARFVIAAEAGPSGTSYLTNTPLLTVNATDPISSYPVRRHGLFTLKRVRDRETGRLLSLDGLLAEDYSLNLRNTTRYQYLDNTPAELVAAVEEMLDDLKHDRADTPAQAAFRTAVAEACVRLRRRHSYVRKWGAEDGFIGDGRLARCSVDGQAPRDGEA